jgi:DNA-binding XRE family transcriptional regulator
MTLKKKQEDLKKRGRKTDFKEEYVQLAFNYALLGATDKQLSDFIGVSERTLNQWKKEYPEFLQSLKKGKEYSDSKVAEKLYSRAIGYEYEEKSTEKSGRKIVKTTITKKQMAPDSTAAIFWLKNRQPDLWRDKQFNELTGKNGESLQPTVFVFPSKNEENDE